MLPGAKGRGYGVVSTADITNDISREVFFFSSSVVSGEGRGVSRIGPGDIHDVRQGDTRVRILTAFRPPRAARDFLASRENTPQGSDESRDYRGERRTLTQRALR